MKKIKLFLVMLFMFFLTGCSSYEMNMEISKDKSMNLSITILSDYEDVIISDNISLLKDKLEQYGFNVSEYDNEDNYGLVINKYYDNIDDISYGLRKDEFDLLYFYNNDYDLDVENKMFNVDKGIDVNRYAANMYIDLSDLDINIENSNIVFKVVVPNGTISNNANLVSEDGNTLTWNISSLGKTDIDFVFEVQSYDVIYYGIGVIVIIFLVFAIFSTLFSKGDDDKNNSKSVTELDKRIYNYNKGNFGNNSVNMDSATFEKTNKQVSNKYVNIDDINRKKYEEKISANKSLDKSGEDITSFKTPNKEKKKEKNSKKNKEEVNVESKKDSVDIFAEMYNSVNSSNNQAGNAYTLNKNSKEDFSINVPIVGMPNNVGNNMLDNFDYEKDNNIEKGVVNINSNSSLNKNKLENDDVEVSSNSGSVIRVNSKNVVLNNKDDDN